MFLSVFVYKSTIALQASELAYMCERVEESEWENRGIQTFCHLYSVQPQPPQTTMLTPIYVQSSWLRSIICLALAQNTDQKCKASFTLTWTVVECHKQCASQFRTFALCILSQHVHLLVILKRDYPSKWPLWRWRGCLEMQWLVRQNKGKFNCNIRNMLEKFH